MRSRHIDNLVWTPATLISRAGAFFAHTASAGEDVASTIFLMDLALQWGLQSVTIGHAAIGLNLQPAHQSPASPVLQFEVSPL